jgi:hypothetical protein
MLIDPMYMEYAYSFYGPLFFFFFFATPLISCSNLTHPAGLIKRPLKPPPIL